jgi:hypothetical protein
VPVPPDSKTVAWRRHARERQSLINFATVPARTSRRGAIIVVPQDPTEPVATSESSGPPPDFAPRLEDLISHSLMRSLGMVMSDELMESAAETLLAEEDHAVQQLAPQREHEALGDRGEAERKRLPRQRGGPRRPSPQSRSMQPIRSSRPRRPTRTSSSPTTSHSISAPWRGPAGECQVRGTDDHPARLDWRRIVPQTSPQLPWLAPARPEQALRILSHPLPARQLRRKDSHCVARTRKESHGVHLRANCYRFRSVFRTPPQTTTRSILTKSYIGLENRSGANHRGFESLPLRHLFFSHRVARSRTAPHRARWNRKRRAGHRGPHRPSRTVHFAPRRKASH